MASAELNGKLHHRDSLPTISSGAREVLASLIENTKLQIPKAVAENASAVVFTPDVDTFLPTPIKMSESVSALWALVGLFASAISQVRYNSGPPKKVVVDSYSATLMLCSVFLFQVGGKSFVESEAAPRAIHLDQGLLRETYRGICSNMFKTADGRYFHLHGSLNPTPSLRMLNLPLHRPDLQGRENVEAVKEIYRAEIAKRHSKDLEIEANERWLMPGAICRTVDEFAETPHGKLNIQEPLYNIHKIQEELPPTSWPQSQTDSRPLAGIKVLDVTKVIAGPTVTRVLALMGAEVLRLSTDTQPEAIAFVADGQIGKRDANVDLKTPEGKLLFDKLAKEADVVVCSYRPGAFDKMGLGRNWVHELARRRGKGIVYCRENCYGWTGEWSGRAGYQPVSDAVTGLSWEQGRFLGRDCPVMPLFPNSDSQTGVTGGLAIMHALLRRSSEGGSYNVDVALNTLNSWLAREVGYFNKQTQTSLRALHPDFRPTHDTGFFEMGPMILDTMKKSNGVGPGELFDQARFAKGIIRWGQENEEAEYLDWRRIVSVENEAGKPDIVLGFEHESCLPGSDQAEWL